jgi:hypothetical protein
MNIKSYATATAICGSLGFPSKMPGTSYGTPAHACKIGGKLRQVKGSTCALCYAFERNNYRYTSVRKAQEFRLAALGHEQWCEAIAYALNKAHGLVDGNVHPKIKSAGWHRWHDSGDLQSLAHLIRIVVVCQMTPRIKHWLPTREVGIVAAFLKGGGEFPDNLCVRLSATMVDGAPSKILPTTSTVHGKAEPRGFTCPAPKQGNECGPCRACWDNANANTSYHLH